MSDPLALARLVGAGDVFVLTGAGLSTDSGIPDYRGRDGVRRVMPMQYAEFVATSEARQRYWARSYVGWRTFHAAGPNAGHHAVTTLQAAGLLSRLVTQNVDGLHAAAGARDVIELHGNLDLVVCLACDERYPRTLVQEWLDETNPGFVEHVESRVSDGSRVSSQIRPDGDVVVAPEAIAGFLAPRCPRCGGDRLKPDVVFFGESVPTARVQLCWDALKASRAVLVLGSSLAVMSGYRFVRTAARDGIPVAIVTRGATRGDAQARVRIDDGLAPTLTTLVADLGL